MFRPVQNPATIGTESAGLQGPGIGACLRLRQRKGPCLLGAQGWKQKALFLLRAAGKQSLGRPTHHVGKRDTHLAELFPNQDLREIGKTRPADLLGHVETEEANLYRLAAEVDAQPVGQVIVALDLFFVREQLLFHEAAGQFLQFEKLLGYPVIHQPSPWDAANTGTAMPGCIVASNRQ